MSLVQRLNEDDVPEKLKCILLNTAENFLINVSDSGIFRVRSWDYFRSGNKYCLAMDYEAKVGGKVVSSKVSFYVAESSE